MKIIVVVITIAIIGLVLHSREQDRQSYLGMFTLCLMGELIAKERDADSRQVAYDCVDEDYENEQKVLSCFNSMSPGALNHAEYQACKNKF